MGKGKAGVATRGRLRPLAVRSSSASRLEKWVGFATAQGIRGRRRVGCSDVGSRADRTDHAVQREERQGPVCGAGERLQQAR